MKRNEIIDVIGKKYFVGNIETDEFSYAKGLKEMGKDYTFYIKESSRRAYKDLDMRFVKSDVSILVETKQKLKDYELYDYMEQLEQYAVYEKELTGNNVIAILASTLNDDIMVWTDNTCNISINNVDKKERVIKTMDEYYDMFHSTKNDKMALIQNTYALNETLHKYGIEEKIRSQFVGTCLLALKNGLRYDGLMTKQIIGGIEEILTNLLDDDLNKATKLAILKNKVLDSQDVRELSDVEFKDVLNTIKNDILPSINDKSTMGQDLLNLFFTTFNKYVGKKDKNQAFTPDHIVHFMSRVVGVNRNSRVLDPCCGSGAFLVRALTDALDDCDDEKQKEEVKKKHIYGIEADETAFGLSTTNMLIHGDGNSNIVLGSCFDNHNIEEANINVVLMNPPYNGQRKHCNPEYVKEWSKDTKIDPSKGFHYVYYIASKVKTGKLAVLLPMQCAIGNSEDLKRFKKKMLEEHNLDAVFSFPNEMFYPGASAIACCMVFNLGIRHEDAPVKETFFGYFKDDGLVKKKNLGRIERSAGLWKQIESEWLELYFNRESKPGMSVCKKVTANDEWLAEAYMETDFTQLTEEDFQETLNDYIAFLVKNGDIYES